MLEQSVRQALTISQGQWTTFISRPISAGILLVSFTLLAAPMLMHIGRIWRRPSSASKDNEES
jgi:putative tricarboxylic transport membrane protein